MKTGGRLRVWQDTGAVLRRLARTFTVLVILAGPGLAQDVPAHVGSAVCSDCHADATAAWAPSDHAKAWTLPDESTVLGDFSNVTFTHHGVTSRFFRDGAKFMIETEDGSGQRRAFEVIGIAGIDPLQQYLLSPEAGRTQTFDIAWDVVAKRWYPVFPDQLAPAGDGLHWTGPYKSWEARCAECHATGYTRNYDATTRTYSPKLAEIGVGCEACHGPGAAHVAWAKSPDLPLAKGLAPFGLTADLTLEATELGTCMTCHSRREALQDGNPVPGTPYHDSYTLSLLRPGLYHPDGQILDEVFEGGSFLQSKMHAKGVRCSDCHEPHSSALKAEGNAVCAQCHSPAGNPRFPSLPLRVFDGPEHHFHPEGSTGAQCVSCHMIERTYMGIDTRRDHSFRIPRPDLAASGAPDACTDCHTDKDAAWAAAELEARFPDSPHRGPHFAPVFSAAATDPAGQADALLEIAEWDGPGIVRASALDMLGASARADQAPRLLPLLTDPDPLVRAAATGALGPLPPDQRLTALFPLLSDPLRAVRVATARALLDAQAAPGTPEAQAISAAMAEWQGSMMLRADFPETHLQLAGVGLTLRNWQMATQAFAEAVSLDPQLVQGWIMQARIAAALEDRQGAARAVSQGLAANPGDANLTALAQEMGLAAAP
jgi:predicted CXXCH cytochrome family protein